MLITLSLLILYIVERITVEKHTNEGVQIIVCNTCLCENILTSKFAISNSRMTTWRRINYAYDLMSWHSAAGFTWILYTVLRDSESTKAMEQVCAQTISINF